jgi:bifunctional ADP-heptose synthase (sugar kinase/adenylyltransferase)
LDTRTKIVEFETAIERGRGLRTAVVTGYFDPLLAQHARRLSEIRDGCDTLIVVLSNAPETILSSQARAELVAALEVVDYVVLPQFPTVADAPGIALFQEEEAHAAQFRRLVDQVRRRHGQPADR